MEVPEILYGEMFSYVFRRYPDRCYAVVIGDRRGPCGHSRVEALKRYRKSGLIEDATTDKTKP